MMLNDFSTLIQLGATLNIAFVAVEYAKAYTHTLSEKVFKFQLFIISSFQDCMELLIDKNTLDHLEPIVIEGKSTNNKIEKAKRDRELLVKEIETEQKRLEENVKLMCESKSLSSLSLFLFLYSTTALFLVGITSLAPQFIPNFWSVLTFLTTLFLVVGWVLGENEKQQSYLDFSLLRHSILYFVFSVIISFILSIILSCCSLEVSVSPCWTYILVSSALIPFTNFIAFLIKIKRKAKAVKNEITRCSSEIKAKCTTLNQSIDALLSVSRLNQQLKIDDQ
ncbi:hypothetical protein SAMN02910431_04618 [Bacteroides sp. AR20]|uniref:hypothetical protein n=1 Tax=Bacteroides sp. AR20 TaxID=93974 RepID=UPI0008CCB400|nr:hypothetical protein [Bacteroides sp. AR20]SEO61763.1 hypothetical protein SAMN02910431_04618 [Bacteroides sp. AR20]